MVKLLIFLLHFYQKYISPLKMPVCRFTPTCSEYAVQAIKRYGPYKGLWMSVCRLSRCHPFHPGGYDPVDAN
ncbi:MAG: membrane protein insertion efficiency factor YidD [Bacillota bacterium]|jgi:putative membrane protein insertion efficiency factor|nr:membrane protein insertion efficiency factor YidD [Bacillota bacterium]HHU30065.1 membrane protein insertion efficiency factor YidD [Bacillota bacterium]